jgi:hypothetical protein
MSGNYSTAVEACSSEYIWYSDSNAEIVSLEAPGDENILIKSLLTGKKMCSTSFQFTI